MRDAEAIARIRREDGVREGVLALTSGRITVTEAFIESLGPADRAFVAVEEGEVAGLGVIISRKTANRAHCAMIALMVSNEFQRHGIGHRLMKEIIDCADEELLLHRLELLVLTDNEKAVNLYKKFGFMVEATRRHAAAVHGEFADEYLMGRLRGEGRNGL